MPVLPALIPWSCTVPQVFTNIGFISPRRCERIAAGPPENLCLQKTQAFAVLSLTSPTMVLHSRSPSPPSRIKGLLFHANPSPGSSTAITSAVAAIAKAECRPRSKTTAPRTLVKAPTRNIREKAPDLYIYSTGRTHKDSGRSDENIYTTVQSTLCLRQIWHLRRA